MTIHETPSRIERLEREQQRLRLRGRWLLAIALAWPLLVLGAGFAVWRASRGASGELHVTRLVVVDEAGQPRAELGLAPGSQEPRLRFSHPDGRPWAALEMAPLPGAPRESRQATFTLQDETGATRVGLGASAQDSGLVLYMAQGTPGLSLYVSEDSKGLVISDGHVPRIHLRYNQHDDAERSELLFWNEEKRSQVDVTAGRGGTSLSLQGPDGQRVFRAP